MSGPRFLVRKVELSTESEGPDYFTHGEFQVTDTTTGRIVARFPWSLDEPYLTNAQYSGPEDVRISEDETEAIAREGANETRILLPGWNRPIGFDGGTIAPDTNFAALARTRDGQWLWKLYERLGSTPQAERLALAISATVPCDAALRFYEFVPDAPGFDAVTTAAEHDASEELLRALARRVRTVHDDTRALDAAKRHVFGPGPRETLLIALAERAPVWLAEHAIEIARTGANRWQELLDAVDLVDMDNLGATAARLVADGVVSRDEVLQYAVGKFPGYGLGEIENKLAAIP